MASSNILRPPSSSWLRSLMLRRWLELSLIVGGLIVARFCTAVPYIASDGVSPEFVLVLAVGLTCVLASRRLHRTSEHRAAPAVVAAIPSTEPAVALVALPTWFAFANVSRLPLMARLMQARLEFAGDALSIKWRGGERQIAYREIARADWQSDGVLVLLRDGRRLLIPTCRPPRFSGPSGHYPELRQAVQAATFATLRHNQDVAERIQLECERNHGVSYRHAPRQSD